ncbi:MAG: RtcB family protein [Candidatus Nanohaloarchaeota archaeon]|nr:RtcB family protein [Candidatus Nanohaloarchaeota archaeon]
MELEKISDYIWKLPKQGNMKVDGIVFSSEKLLEIISKDRTLWQLSNVASLQGIVKNAIAMPDAHEGYGFPIGGVAAFDIEEEGIISPGGVGFDINCGVRLLRTNLSYEEIEKHKVKLVDTLFKNIPSGLGSKAKIKFTKSELEEIAMKGVDYVIKQGFGWKHDKEYIEEKGSMKNASVSYISEKAKERGRVQIGSLGSGNHFLELQVVEKVFNEEVAKALGIFEGQVTVMIHTGSRGFGHQIASDFLKLMEKHVDIASLPDRELVSVSFLSEIGQQYYQSMNAAANFAFTNRQLITHWVRESFESVLDQDAKALDLNIIYDVTHNMAKLETYSIQGEKKKLVVHRKGATRSLYKHHPLLKDSPYYNLGQPVLIPGSMGTASYLLIGGKKAEDLSFNSTAHGAGRVMSRSKAIKTWSKHQIESELKQKGIYLRSSSWRGVVEEAPQAYKDVDEVVKVSDTLQIATLVAKLKPIGVVKG